MGTVTIEQSKDKKFRTFFLQLSEDSEYSCCIEDIQTEQRYKGPCVILDLEVVPADNTEICGHFRPYINRVEELGSIWHRFVTALFGKERVAEGPIESAEFLGKVFECKFKKIFVGKNKDKERWPLSAVKNLEGEWVSLSL